MEGKRDVEALHELEIRGRIIPAKSGGKSLLDLLGVIEACGKDEVILLMDFDRRGKELTKYLTQRLERMKKAVANMMVGYVVASSRTRKPIDPAINVPLITAASPQRLVVGPVSKAFPTVETNATTIKIVPTRSGL